METAAERKPKRLKNALLCGSLAAVLAVPTMLAYLTDSDAKTNKFSFAEALTVEVVEPSWDETDANGNGVPDAAEGVVPMQAIPKDPSAKVTGADAYVFMEVKVPVATLVTDNGSAAYAQPVFTFDVNDNWTLMANASMQSPGQATDGYMKYVYKYVGGDNGVLANGETTEPVFTEVVVPNVKSNEGKPWTSEKSDIPVKAHVIQAEGFEDADAAWTAYKGQTGL